ncbi:MAG: GntR family transcriptional regulator [bacterium]|nr:GntR family transcriptional regulator [bacterium]
MPNVTQCSFTDRKALAYQNLKHKIITGRLEPNTVIHEKLLAEELTISRTPVHEAVQELVREGLLCVLPRRGTLVAPISLEDIHQMYQLRRILEPQLLLESASKLDHAALLSSRDYYARCASGEGDEEKESCDTDRDADFHLFLASASKNRFVMQVLEQMMAQTLRIRSLSNIWVKNRYQEACLEHVEIVEALLSEKPEEAAAAMLRHLKNSEEGYRQLLSRESMSGEETIWNWH